MPQALEAAASEDQELWDVIMALDGTARAAAPERAPCMRGDK